MKPLTDIRSKLNLIAQQNITEYIRVEQAYQPCNLLLWLKAQSTSVKIYWRDKDNSLETAMIGICHEISQLDEKNRLNGARYYGGIAFNRNSHTQNAVPLSTSSHFSYDEFILPRLSLTQRDNKYYLSCHLDCLNNKVEDEVSACLTLLDQLKDAFTLCPPIQNRVIARTDIPTKDHWCVLVNKAMSEITTNLLKKVVLSRQTSLEFERPIDPWTLLNEWSFQNNNCYQFAFQFSPEQTFIGCSPERLYLRTGATLITEALAGTALRGITQQTDDSLANSLLNDPKLLRENVVVRDDILSRLNDLCLDIGIDQAFVLKLKNIQHLKQRIHAFLKPSVNDLTLIEQLHPTPAVGGSPRRKSLDFIFKNEPYTRGWYSGAVGFISDEQSEFSVAIRSALIENGCPLHLHQTQETTNKNIAQTNKIKLYAGAGIVNGSQAALEWQELNDKISNVLALLLK